MPRRPLRAGPLPDDVQESFGKLPLVCSEVVRFLAVRQSLLRRAAYLMNKLVRRSRELIQPDRPVFHDRLFLAELLELSQSAYDLQQHADRDKRASLEFQDQVKRCGLHTPDAETVVGGVLHAFDAAYTSIASFNLKSMLDGLKRLRGRVPLVVVARMNFDLGRWLEPLAALSAIARAIQAVSSELSGIGGDLQAMYGAVLIAQEGRNLKNRPKSPAVWPGHVN